MSLNTIISLEPKQQDMFNALMGNDVSEVLFYGTSRSGKTFLILYWMIMQCIVFETNCLILRNMFTSLQTGMLNQTLPAVLKCIAKINGLSSIDDLIMANGKPFCKFNGKNNTLTFFNNAYIQFSSLRGSSDTASSYDKILSTEWGHIFADEVSEIDEMAIDILRTRLAQKIECPESIKAEYPELAGGIENKMIYALNPTSKLHWTYKRFFKHEDRDGKPIPPSVYKRFLMMHFNDNDNTHVSASYYANLDNLSTLQRKRFKEGMYSDEAEGEIFKKITWGKCPAAEEFTACVIYCDPSAKDQKTNDYKATVLLGLARNKIWLINARAVQGTSFEMMENIYDLVQLAPITPKIYIEKKQVPLDFQKTFDQFCDDRAWFCPFEWDTRNHGDKFTNIESTLEPLFRSERFVFCNEMQDSGILEITIDQFLRFSRKIQRDRKDDIPDACAKGTAMLMRVKPMENLNSVRNREVLLIKPGRLTAM